MLRALRNPVVAARIAGHDRDTLRLDLETTKGRFRWDVKPVYRSEIETWKKAFVSNWKAALKALIRESIGIYPTKLNPDISAQWSKPWKKKITGSYTRWTKLIGPYRLFIEHFPQAAKYFSFILDRKTGVTRAPSGASNSLRDAIERLRLEIQGRLNVSLPGPERVRTLFNPARSRSSMMFNPRRPSWADILRRHIESASWTWTKSSTIHNRWIGKHLRYVAHVDKSGTEYWTWVILSPGGKKRMAEGDAETSREAKRAVEKWRGTPQPPRMLFNPSDLKWRHVGNGEYVTEYQGLVGRVRYGRVYRRYYWTVHRNGAEHALQTGSHDTFPGAKNTVASYLKGLSQRTLFNPLEWRHLAGGDQVVSWRGFDLMVGYRRPSTRYYWWIWIHGKSERLAWGFAPTSAGARAAAEEKARSLAPKMLFNMVRR